MENKIFRYYAVAVRGLEEVVADELKAELPEVAQVHLERGKRQGRVFFAHRRSPRQLLALQTPLSMGGVLAQVQGITVGGPGLERLLQQLAHFPLVAAQSLLRACEPESDAGLFQLSVTLQGAHRFTKSEVVQRFQAQLGARGLAPGQGRALLRLHLQVDGARALLGLQVGPNRADQCNGEGGIGGPLSASLGRLLPANGDEVLLVLGCGQQGAEALAASGSRAAVIALGEWRRGVSAAGVALVRGLPEALPAGGGAANLVLAAGLQSPFGAQLREVARVLHPGGVAALLAAESRPLAAMLRASGEFFILAGLPINLNGRALVLWMLERLEEPAALLQIAGAGANG